METNYTANAIALSTSNCNLYEDYALGMDLDEISQWRRARLGELLAQKYGGNKAALGRALGYQNGAFVSQMLLGSRPVSEKTVAQIQAKPGLSRWFSVDAAGPTQQALPPYSGSALELAALFDELFPPGSSMAVRISAYNGATEMLLQASRERHAPPTAAPVQPQKPRKQRV